MATVSSEYDFSVGDVGVSISARFSSSLDGLTLQWIFTKPSGDEITKSATIDEDQAVYTWQAEDLDEEGEWEGRLYNATTGYTYKNRVSFTVGPA